MTTKTKAQIDAEIYELVKEGKLTKTAIAQKFNTSKVRKRQLLSQLIRP